MAFELSVKMVDDYQRNMSKRFELTAADYATAQTDIATIIAALNAVTDAGVVSYILSEKTAVGDSPTAGANRDEGVTLSVLLQDTEKGSIKIPAPVKTALDANGNLDITDAAWVAFVNLYGSGNEALLSDGDHVIQFLAGQLDA
jgi:hypothetical protein